MSCAGRSPRSASSSTPTERRSPRPAEVGWMSGPSSGGQALAWPGQLAGAQEKARGEPRWLRAIDDARGSTRIRRCARTVGSAPSDRREMPARVWMGPWDRAYEVGLGAGRTGSMAQRRYGTQPQDRAAWPMATLPARPGSGWISSSGRWVSGSAKVGNERLPANGAQNASCHPRTVHVAVPAARHHVHRSHRTVPVVRPHLHEGPSTESTP